MYAKYFKRLLDFILSSIALLVLSPLLLLLTVVGAIAMRGNPFFLQPRPGKKGSDGKEKIFKLIKFRTMTNARDKNGDLLPSQQRLNKYGRFLRKTSCDELPSLINIVLGHLSICGPRPLLVKYLPLYSEEQRHRHDVRPGLTGYAQVHGRNKVSWEERFAFDIWYINNVSLKTDIGIIIDTIKIVLKKDGVEAEGTIIMKEFTGSELSQQKKGEEDADLVYECRKES